MANFDDHEYEGAGMAQQRARKFFQAQGERNDAETDRYNGKLMRNDVHFSRLMEIYFKLPISDRESFVNRALSGEVTS